ncbi:MAG TPA: hypothetical protein EYH36_05350 [Desulfocapsa sulfexigens]|nr:hypothetical protein [Desulfocapsa sulfexigens]
MFSSNKPTFPSVTLARAWAVACGVPLSRLSGVVSGSPGRWSSVLNSPSAKPSCLFCRKLGRCSGSSCSFQPSKHWPGKGAQPVQKKLF